MCSNTKHICPWSVFKVSCKKIIIKKNWHAKWHVQHVDIHVAACQYPYVSNMDTTTILRCSCFLVYPFYLASPLWALMMFCCVSCVSLALGMVIITLLGFFDAKVIFFINYVCGSLHFLGVTHCSSETLSHGLWLCNFLCTWCFSSLFHCIWGLWQWELFQVL